MGGMPFAELHLHLEGTLEPETDPGLAERNRIDAALRRRRRALGARTTSRTCSPSLNLYYANMAMLQTAADFADMTDAYLRRAARAGVRARRGLPRPPGPPEPRRSPLEAVMDGVSTALDPRRAARRGHAAV